MTPTAIYKLLDEAQAHYAGEGFIADDSLSEDLLKACKAMLPILDIAYSDVACNVATIEMENAIKRFQNRRW